MLLVWAFAGLIFSQAIAQSPEAFKYQAVVRDANYAPIANQNVKVRLSIVEGTTTGPIIYQEAHDVTTSAIGLFSLNVGEGTVTGGSFDSIDFQSGGDLFLQVEVDQLGGTNYQPLGISQLLSVPFSLYATKAGSVDNTDDADADPFNEFQDLSLDGNDLSITQGNTVTLPTFTAGEGIRIDSNVISNQAPSLWQLDSNVVFVDTQKVAIGLTDSTDFPEDADLFVNGNVRVADDSSLLGVGEIVGANDLSFSANENRDGDMTIASNGRVRFEEEVGINQVFSFVDLNIRNQQGNSTVFQVEDTAGLDIFEVGRGRNVGINRITGNVTLQVRCKDPLNTPASIIANFERENGDNVFQIQNDQDVVVTGDFSVNSGNKNFILDHPLDPANKILAHNAVESPDHVTYYHGTVQLDSKGEAVVSLPSYFEALNTDYHYQLTCIGGFAQVYIGKEIMNNTFTIAGGQPGMKVSWQVSARRDDPWAHDHPYEAEMDKEPWEKGKYFYPEGYGKGRAYKIGAGDDKEDE
ncbi:MAG: hypothetical protein AAFO96_21535 [Bacteroidota bacterium]